MAKHKPMSAAAFHNALTALEFKTYEQAVTLGVR